MMASTIAMLAATLAVGAPLPITVGDYVRDGVPCADAPLAEMMSFDGAHLSGPHATSCQTSVVSHRGATWRVRSTCAALGDGTAAKPFTQLQTIRVLTRTRVTVADGSGAGAAVFRFCPTHN